MDSDKHFSYYGSIGKISSLLVGSSDESYKCSSERQTQSFSTESYVEEN
jgi:hypothetical protein